MRAGVGRAWLLAPALVVILQRRDGQQRDRQAQPHENELGKLLTERHGGKRDERYDERDELAQVGDAIVERGMQIATMPVGVGALPCLRRGRLGFGRSRRAGCGLRFRRHGRRRKRKRGRGRGRGHRLVERR